MGLEHNTNCFGEGMKSKNKCIIIIMVYEKFTYKVYMYQIL